MCIGPEAIDDSSEGVFEKFKTDVRKMAWYVGEDEVGRADELDGGAFKHGIVFFADEACVLDSFLYNVVDVSFSTNDAYIVFVWLLCV